MYIECRNLGKRIKDAQILSTINMRLESGKVYGLWGKNGCGKTMLMRAMCGLLHPVEGEVILDGQVLGKDVEMPISVGLLLENPAFLHRYTGYENLRMLASIKGLISEEQVRNTMRRVGLDPNDKRKYYKYSMGMKQRLGIACAIMEEPEMILLDEPVNALDVDGVKNIRAILSEEKERGALIVVACHDKEEMSILADQVIVMKQGTIADIVTRI